MPSKTHRLFEVVAFIQLDPVGEIFGYLRHGMNPVHVELAGALQPDKTLENQNMRINCNPRSARDLREAVDRSSAFKVEFGTREMTSPNTLVIVMIGGSEHKCFGSASYVPKHRNNYAKALSKQLAILSNNTQAGFEWNQLLRPRFAMYVVCALILRLNRFLVPGELIGRPPRFQGRE